MPCSINNEHLPNKTDAVMRAVSLSLGEAWMHSLDRPMPAPPQGPPRGGCILGPHISVALDQKTANFKVTIESRVLQWGALTEGKQKNELTQTEFGLNNA